MTQAMLAAEFQLNGYDMTRSGVAKIETGQRHLYSDEIIPIQKMLNTFFESISEI